MAFAKLTCGATVAVLALGALVLQMGCAANELALASASHVEKEFAGAAVTWDLNQDGDVTCDEWKQYGTALFREADANRDGFLNREEFAAMARTDRLFETAGFPYFDTDGNGRISQAELIDKPNPAFALLDRNKDCVITPDERMPPRGGGDSSGGGGKVKGRRGR